jgi:hypothetical protein
MFPIHGLWPIRLTDSQTKRLTVASTRLSQSGCIKHNSRRMQYAPVSSSELEFEPVICITAEKLCKSFITPLCYVITPPLCKWERSGGSYTSR